MEYPLAVTTALINFLRLCLDVAFGFGQGKDHGGPVLKYRENTAATWEPTWPRASDPNRSTPPAAAAVHKCSASLIHKKTRKKKRKRTKEAPLNVIQPAITRHSVVCKYDFGCSGTTRDTEAAFVQTGLVLPDWHKSYIHSHLFSHYTWWFDPMALMKYRIAHQFMGCGVFLFPPCQSDMEPPRPPPR